MKADNRGVVMHLRRAVREGETELADFLTDEIVRHLDLLDVLTNGEGAPPKAQEERAPVTRQTGQEGEALREAALECAADLEAEINDRYHGPDDVHPALRYKYERDMEIVVRIRALAASRVQPVGSGTEQETPTKESNR